MKLMFASILILAALDKAHGKNATHLLRKRFLSPTCSPGGNLTCDAANPCNSEIRNCSVLCTNASAESSACEFASFFDSKVECQVFASCYYMEFYRSDITCVTNVSCVSSTFYASAVEYGLASSTGSFQEEFGLCSCCGGPGCNEERCFGSDGKPGDFCATTYLGRTCKEWGNPACVSANVPSMPPLHPKSSCSPFKEEIVICKEGERDCVGKNISGCSVACDNTCRTANISDSHVLCSWEYSCYPSRFYRSHITCSRHENSCYGAMLTASAVLCEESADGLNTNCPQKYFFDGCSCCEGPGCIQKSCRDLDGRLDGFCASTYLGRTCKDWGNPACVSVEVTSAPPPLHPKSSCSPFREEIVTCELPIRDCTNEEVSNCSVVCIDSCGKTFSDSHVVCRLDPDESSQTCRGTEFTRSNVTCYPGTCFEAIFKASAVLCDKESDCPGKEAFDGCSCCEGSGCPSDVANCSSVCNKTTVDGLTCASSGNPVCVQKTEPLVTTKVTDTVTNTASSAVAEVSATSTAATTAKATTPMVKPPTVKQTTPAATTVRRTTPTTTTVKRTTPTTSAKNMKKNMMKKNMMKDEEGKEVQEDKKDEAQPEEPFPLQPKPRLRPLVVVYW